MFMYIVQDTLKLNERDEGKKINYFHFAIKYRALIGYKHPFIMYHKVLIIIHKPMHSYMCVVYSKRRCFHISEIK